jgi:hypothetical protein
MSVFENRVLRCIFEPMRDEIIGGWRNLFNEKLNYLYSSPNMIRMITSKRMRLAGHVACTRQKRNAYRPLAGKPEGSLGSRRRR